MIKFLLSSTGRSRPCSRPTWPIYILSTHFECKHCGHKAQVDQNGALNLLLRVNDPEYRRYMTKEAVKKLERGRYEEWCQARQEEPIKESVNRKRLKKAA